MPPFPLIDKVPDVLKPYILDFLWDMEKLHQLELPMETVQIADLLWHLDLPWWQHDGAVFCLSPKQVWDDPEKYHEQYARTQKVDLQHPIIVRRQGEKLVIMDGVHRLLKAAMLGNDQVEVKLFSEEYTPQITK